MDLSGSGRGYLERSTEELQPTAREGIEGYGFQITDVLRACDGLTSVLEMGQLLKGFQQGLI